MEFGGARVRTVLVHRNVQIKTSHTQPQQQRCQRKQIVFESTKQEADARRLGVKAAMQQRHGVKTRAQSPMATRKPARKAAAHTHTPCWSPTCTKTRTRRDTKVAQSKKTNKQTNKKKQQQQQTNKNKQKQTNKNKQKQTSKQANTHTEGQRGDPEKRCQPNGCRCAARGGSW